MGIETNPINNRPVMGGADKKLGISQEDLQVIEKGIEHAEAINSPAGKVFIAETLVELENTFNKLISVDTTSPNLSLNYFIGLVTKCQAHMEILRRFGFVINYGEKLAGRQVSRAIRS